MQPREALTGQGQGEHPVPPVYPQGSTPALTGELLSPRRRVRIIVGIQLVGAVIVVAPITIVSLIFPIIRPFIMPPGLPVGIVVRVHLVGMVIVVTGHKEPPPKGIRPFYTGGS